MVRVEDLGAALRAAREKAGMELEDLAQAAHIYYMTIKRIEAGITIPKRCTLVRLAKVLPGAGLEEYLEPVARHYRAVQARRRSAHHYQPDQTRSGPPGPKASIAEICRAANAAGMSYGQYVARMRTEVRRR